MVTFDKCTINFTGTSHSLSDHPTLFPFTNLALTWACQSGHLFHLQSAELPQCSTHSNHMEAVPSTHSSFSPTKGLL